MTGAVAPRAVVSDRGRLEADMIGRIRRPRDPFWDEGKGARRTHRRVQFEGLLAVAMAIVAVGVTAAVWIRLLAPLATTIGIR